MHQAGGTDAQLPGLSPQTQAQSTLQRQAAFLDIADGLLDVKQAKRQGRFIDITEHFPEECFMSFAAHAQTRLGHIVAIRYRAAQLVGQAQQVRLHIVVHHFHRGVIHRHVVEQQHRHPALVRRVFGEDQAHQRGLSQIQSQVLAVETLMQLLDDIAIGRVQFDLFQRQPRLTPDHLHRCLKALPEHCGTQDVMPVDHTLQGVDKGVQTLPTSHLEQALQDVGVALLGREVVIENAFLQRCQRVDILHVCHAARYAGDNAIDRRLVEIGQG